MKKLLVICLLVLMVGCAKKQIVATDGTPPPEGVQVEEEFVEAVIVPGDEVSIEETDLTAGELAVFDDIHFDYDKYTIKPTARAVLDKVSDFLYNNKKFNVVIEGHCDDRGTNEYNLALGEKRAKAAQGYLSSLGVGSSRMSIQTYGEEKPLCTEQNESCWQRNRRAHFILIK